MSPYNRILVRIWSRGCNPGTSLYKYSNTGHRLFYSLNSYTSLFLFQRVNRRFTSTAFIHSYFEKRVQRVDDDEGYSDDECKYIRPSSSTNRLVSRCRLNVDDRRRTDRRARSRTSLFPPDSALESGRFRTPSRRVPCTTCLAVSGECCRPARRR